MPTHKPRVNVTFSEGDAEILSIICKKNKLSLSALVRKVTEDWLEDYEDMFWSIRAGKAYEEWVDSGCETITHEEVCKRLNIKSNIKKKH